jgi:TetR/AcrR family transcriptional regulator, cholesterol catabolism regulator
MQRKASKNIRTENLNLKRRLIAEVAAGLFVQKGYTRTTSDEIAAACNMGVGTLYYYIKSKDDFPIIFGQMNMADVLKWEKKIRKEMQVTPPPGMMRKTVGEYLRLVTLRGKILRFWYENYNLLSREQTNDITEAENRTIAIFQNIIEHGCRNGQFSCEDPFITAYNIILMVHLWVLRQWRIKDLYSIDQYSRLLQDMVISLVHGPAA